MEGETGGLGHEGLVDNLEIGWSSLHEIVEFGCALFGVDFAGEVLCGCGEDEVFVGWGCGGVLEGCVLGMEERSM